VDEVRVLLVDDNDDFLTGAASWLATDPELELVGTARSGLEAMDEVERLKPDLVLMDVTMPDVSGFDATRRIKSSDNSPRVILLTLHHSEVAREEAAAAVADGYVAKNEITEQLLPTIRELLR